MNDWLAGNSVRLLRNGEQFFPRVFDSIARAEREVIIETFILCEDKVGMALHAALCTAARRGVQVDLTVDGWGSPDLSEPFVGALTAAGVRLHVFDPGPRPFGWRPKLLRRMHRKIVVDDGVRGRHQLLGRSAGARAAPRRAARRGCAPDPAGPA